MGPIYNRIHLGLGISPKLPWQNGSVTNSLFSGPCVYPKKVPGPKCQPGDPKSNPGLKTSSPGMKKQKMRAEKPCRIQSLEFQTEPYSASYGQKPFWGEPVKILKYLRDKILSSKREILFSKRAILHSKRAILHSKREILHSKREILHSKMGILHSKKETLHSRKGIPMGPGTMGPGPWDQGPWDQPILSGGLEHLCLFWPRGGFSWGP